MSEERANGNSLHSLVGLSGFRCIVADPPWPFKGTGAWNNRRSTDPKNNGNRKPQRVAYPTMTHTAIEALPIAGMAEEDCHLWLWTDNTNLHAGFHVMQAWGFKYLAPIHWIKPAGCGMWWVHRTQTILFGYRGKCRFPLARFRPNLFTSSNPARHSEKPGEAFTLIESVSPGPRLELFARRPRENWTVWGNEVEANAAFVLYPANNTKGGAT